MKIWEKGYNLEREVEEYTVGNDYLLDRYLLEYDCLASIAHARMLNMIGILTDDEFRRLHQELSNILMLYHEGRFIIKPEDEDCHTAIERHLIEELGEVGKKIHTGRSRNDQVLAALRLFYRQQLKNTRQLIRDFISAVENFITRYADIPLPGYTHMRKAMPSSVLLWGTAFIESMRDNLKLIDTAACLADQSPLGTGAGYGIPLNLDREMVAKELGFSRIQENPIYVQLSRGKFEAAILHALSQVLFDLNRISTDLITFSMTEFGYFILPDELCTGSSIMPQKKNPDVLELVRAKYHLLVSLEMQVKTLPANLMTGYNRDVQLTKEPVIQGFDIALRTLSVMKLLFEKLEVDENRCREAMTPELFATKKAYELVREGVPFREAYQRVAREYVQSGKSDDCSD